VVVVVPVLLATTRSWLLDHSTAVGVATGGS